MLLRDIQRTADSQRQAEAQLREKTQVGVGVGWAGARGRAWQAHRLWRPRRPGPRRPQASGKGLCDSEKSGWPTWGVHLFARRSAQG